MTKIAPREFKVNAADFPITIEIEAKDMQVCQATFSSILVTDDDIQLISQVDAPFVLGEDGLSRTITLEAGLGPQMHVSILSGFSTVNGPNPKYQVEIAPNGGAAPKQTTVIRGLSGQSKTAYLLFHFS